MLSRCAVRCVRCTYGASLFTLAECTVTPRCVNSCKYMYGENQRLGSRALRVLFDPSTQSCEEPRPLRMTISCEITNTLCITDIKITDRQAGWRDLVCLCKCTRVRPIQGYGRTTTNNLSLVHRSYICYSQFSSQVLSAGTICSHGVLEGKDE